MFIKRWLQVVQQHIAMDLVSSCLQLVQGSGSWPASRQRPSDRPGMLSILKHIRMSNPTCQIVLLLPMLLVAMQDIIFSVTLLLICTASHDLLGQLCSPA